MNDPREAAALVLGRHRIYWNNYFTRWECEEDDWSALNRAAADTHQAQVLAAAGLLADDDARAALDGAMSPPQEGCASATAGEFAALWNAAELADIVARLRDPQLVANHAETWARSTVLRGDLLTLLGAWDDAHAALDRVFALHRDRLGIGVCEECDHGYPCSTIRAARPAPTEEPQP